MSESDVLSWEIGVSESWRTLPDLRWNKGVLEQAHEVVTYSPTGSVTMTARIEWKPVPEAEDHPNG